MILMARSTGLHFSERPWLNDCLRAGECVDVDVLSWLGLQRILFLTASGVHCIDQVKFRIYLRRGIG